MSVTAEDLLDWAKSIPIQDEVDLRAIVSRAYYAAYHRCKDWHGALHYHGSCSMAHAGEHEKLIQQLKNPSMGIPAPRQKLSRDLGKKLEALKALRVLADYRLGRQMATGLEAQACAEADDILANAVWRNVGAGYPNRTDDLPLTRYAPLDADRPCSAGIHPICSCACCSSERID